MCERPFSSDIEMNEEIEFQQLTMGNQVEAMPIDVIDLDRLVTKWIFSKWKKFRPDHFFVLIDWENVVFQQDSLDFIDSSIQSYPRCRRLYRTNFENQTINEQIFALRTERVTQSTLKFNFTQTLSKSNDSSIVFRLPDSIGQLAENISREQKISLRRETTKEYPNHWSIDTQLRVPCRSRTTAELFIDEEEFQSDFRIALRFSGQIKATIRRRNSPEICLKSINDDIVTIVADLTKTNGQQLGLEIRGDRNAEVHFDLLGRCSFRYGVQQEVIVDQQPLAEFHCYPSAPTKSQGRF